MTRKKYKVYCKSTKYILIRYKRGDPMKVIFQNKRNKKMIEHENVKWFTTEDKLFGVSGIGLHFEDGTFCIIDNCFKLVMVTE